MENSQLKDMHSYCYNLETKQFAMTLYYYSPKAYEFVCNIFFLPHSSTIRSWATSVDCEPGFFSDVTRLIGKVAKTKPHMLDVVLIVNAMELHKGTWWNQKKRCYIGRVDNATALLEAGDNLATEALVFIIGSCNRSLETSNLLLLVLCKAVAAVSILYYSIA